MSRETRHFQGPRAKKRLGQHFLTAPGTAKRIVDALDLGPEDRVLEIGPGRGALTRWIMEAGPGIATAVERDEELAPWIRQTWPGLHLVLADALELCWERFHGWKVVGNLPYNVASPILWELAAGGAGVVLGVFMVQKEVGQRLTAAPGGKEYGALSVWVQCHAHLKALFTVGPGVFNPPPKVDSMVFSMIPRREGRPNDPQVLNRLLKLCFQSRRKQLSTILRDWRGDALEGLAEELDIRLTDRPERLTPEQFLGLSQGLLGRPCG